MISECINEFRLHWGLLNVILETQNALKMVVEGSRHWKGRSSHLFASATPFEVLVSLLGALI